MSLASRLTARSRRPTATVRIGGRRWADVLSLSREQSYGQGVSGGDVVGRNPPVEIVEGETTISWTWGYDHEEVRGFTGVVRRILQKSYPNQVQLQVADPLWLADIRRRDIATSPLNAIPASDAIEQILGGAGITRMSIPALPASGSAWAGSEWILGTLTPVAFPNTTALAAAQRICEVMGYWLYCDAGGIVRATPLERRPSDSPFRTLRWEHDFILRGTPERERDASQVRNRVVVRGANTGVQGAQIWDEWVAGAGDRTHEFQSDLIEYVNEAEAGAASATGVAKRIIKVWSRQPNVIRIGVFKADPRLSVGMTVAVECGLIGYSSPKPFFVYSLQTSLDLRRGDFTQALILDGGTGTDGYTTIPPPEASFSWRIVRETLDGVGVIELFLDGTASRSLAEGEIVNYAWATSTATALSTPDTATGPLALFIYPAATATAEVTLTVTDTSSKTGTLSQVIPLIGDELVTPTSRVISLALGAAWAVTPDGGETWNVEATGDSTLVPELSGETLLSTRETGSTGLRGSADALASASTVLDDLSGQITALSVTPNTTRVWAAVGASLYRSTDDGATFALWGTLPATVAWVLEDPAVPSSVFVLAGADMLHSTLETPGTAWVVLYAGPDGATARQLVRGESGATTWIAYTGTFVGSPLQRVEGPITAVWPLDTSPEPTEVRAIALSPDEATVYAWDGEGRGWRVDSATGVATACTATLAAEETAQHALHDPDDSIVYLATFGEAAGTTYKYFPLINALLPFYVPAAGQQAHRVGLGGGVRRAADVILVPWGASGANDRIWRYDAGAATWLPGIMPPQAGWYWYSLTVNPFNGQEWLLVGNDTSPTADWRNTAGTVRPASNTAVAVAYYSGDGGATWSPITLDGAEGFNFISPAGAGWSEGVAGWLIAAAAAPSNYGPSGATRIWRGTGAAAAGVTVEATVATLIGGGQGTDVLLTRDSDGSIGVYDGSAITYTSGASPGTWVARPVRLPNTRTLVGVRAGALWRTADYRVAQPATTGVGIAGTRIGAATHGAYVSPGTTGQIERVATPDATPVVTSTGPVADLGPIRVAPRGRAAVAVLGQTGGGPVEVFVSLDGASWVAIGGPAGVTGGEVGASLEVVAEDEV